MSSLVTREPTYWPDGNPANDAWLYALSTTTHLPNHRLITEVKARAAILMTGPSEGFDPAYRTMLDSDLDKTRLEGPGAGKTWKNELNYIAALQAHFEDGFPKFSALPAELRLKIWDYCRPAGQTIEMRFARKKSGKMYDFVYPEYPIVLRVSHESRLQALKSYKVMFDRPILCPAGAYFDRKRDRLYIRLAEADWERYSTVWDIVQSMPNVDEVARLVVINDIGLINSEVSMPLPMAFPKLEELWIAYSVHVHDNCTHVGRCSEIHRADPNGYHDPIEIGQNGATSCLFDITDTCIYSEENSDQVVVLDASELYSRAMKDACWVLYRFRANRFNAQFRQISRNWQEPKILFKCEHLSTSLLA